VINIFAVARDFVPWSAGHEQTITAPYLAEAIAKSLCVHAGVSRYPEYVDACQNIGDENVATRSAVYSNN